MKTVWRGLVIVLVLSVGLLGCTQSGYLTIDNKTAGGISVSVNGDDENIDANDDQTWEYEFPGFVLNLIQQKTEDVDIDYVGWFVLPDSDTVTVEAGDDITYDIDPNAGVWEIQNNSFYTITGIFVTESTNPSWGDNLTSGVVPGSWADYGPLSTTSWDLRVVDSTATEWYVYGEFPISNNVSLFSLESDGYLYFGDGGEAVLPLAGGSSGSLKVGP